MKFYKTICAVTVLTMASACGGSTTDEAETTEGSDGSPAAASEPGEDEETASNLASCSEEGSVVVMGSVLPTSVVEAIGTILDEEYGVSVEHIPTTAPETLQRLRSEVLADEMTGDVLVIGGQYGAVAKNEGLLQTADFPDESTWQYERGSENQWLAYAAEPYGIMVNRDLAGDEWPQSWDALAEEPSFSEPIIMDDPTRGSVGFTWTVAALEGVLTDMDGEEYLAAIGSLPNFAFTANTPDARAQVVRGSAAAHFPVGVHYMEEVRGTPAEESVDFANPGGVAYVVAHNVGLIANAPHPGCGQAFIDALTSDEIQERLTEVYVVPGNAEIAESAEYPYEVGQAVAPDAQIYLDAQEEIEGSAEWFGR